MVRMKRPTRSLPAGALLLLCTLLAGCSPIQVTTDYDPAVSFAAYRTYAWIPHSQQRTGDARLDSSLLHDRIREAVERHLAAKGYTKAESGSPDFLVTYHVAIRGKLNVTTMSNYGYGPGWRAARVGAAGTTTFVQEYDEGSLLVDIVEPAKRHLAWRGSAKAQVPETSTSEERTARIDEAVGKILAGFPPKPAGAR
jgi:hypothetical protein